MILDFWIVMGLGSWVWDWKFFWVLFLCLEQMDVLSEPENVAKSWVGDTIEHGPQSGTKLADLVEKLEKGEEKLENLRVDSGAVPWASLCGGGQSKALVYQRNAEKSWKASHGICAPD